MTVLELKELIKELPDDVEIKVDGTRLVHEADYCFGNIYLPIKSTNTFGERVILLVPDY